MVYFDMDGVLVVYDWGGYKINPDTGLMLYETPGSHYFLHREKDYLAIELFKYCLEIFGDDVCVITSVSKKPDIRYEQISDKMAWLYKEVPEFDIGSKFIAVSSDKRNFIMGIRGMSLNRRDILVDDWKVNLYKWAMSGGTAVKYLNGINCSNSWAGLTIDGNNSVVNAQKCLLDIVSKINKI